MDIVAARNLQFQTLDRFGAKHGDSLKLPIAFREKKRVQAFVPPCRRTSSPSKLACSRHKSKATLEAGGFQVTIDEELVLKNNLRVFEQHLKGRCIYLVGMMGSGKTTVGKILSEVLKYDFYDCDKLVEDEVGGTSVADIFKHYGEDFFRDKETGALQKLSMMDRLVIATGGGAVIRPINWKYMHKGVSIWLDVPIEVLAHRITAVGTGSRPLLHKETGDAYTQTLMRLSSLIEARLEAYANANVRVSLANVAANLGDKDVLDLSPITIAIEALMQITGFLKNEGGHYDGC